MLVLSIGLFGKSAYDNVIVNGLILAEDGQKMSKKLKNYPDPVTLINTYGADSLRYYLLSSPVVRGENLNFSEKDVQEVMNKIIVRLRNVCAFYELYSMLKPGIDFPSNLRPATHAHSNFQSKHILDKWIYARLEELIERVTSALERYELDKAVRPIGDFVEDLSTWYIRRSRDRFKGRESDAKEALSTTRLVLQELSKIMAPFTPFIAEEVCRTAVKKHEIESVHLSPWPYRDVSYYSWWDTVLTGFFRLLKKDTQKNILSDMKRVREIVSFALLARTKNGLRVRQPLNELRVKHSESRIKNNPELVNLIKEEVNVKNVTFGADIVGEVELDTRITPLLEREGVLRELIRHTQDLRKKEDLIPAQIVDAVVDTDEAGRRFVLSFEQELKKILSLKKISFEQALGEKITIGKFSFVIELKK